MGVRAGRGRSWTVVSESSSPRGGEPGTRLYSRCRFRTPTTSTSQMLWRRGVGEGPSCCTSATMSGSRCCSNVSRHHPLAEVEDGEEVVTVAGRISHRLAIPASAYLPRLREQADAGEEQVRKDADELTHALSLNVVDATVATIRELGRTQPDTLIHGDLHGRIILRADRGPWLAVDPKGYSGDPAYDGGTLL